MKIRNIATHDQQFKPCCCLCRALYTFIYLYFLGTTYLSFFDYPTFSFALHTQCSIFNLFHKSYMQTHICIIVLRFITYDLGFHVLQNILPRKYPKPDILLKTFTKKKKKLWEKEKLLVTNNFSFSCSVFYP